MSLKNRVVILFAFSTLLIITVFGLSASSLARVNAVSARRVELNNEVLGLVAEASYTLERIRVLNLTHVLLETGAEAAGIEAERRAEIERFRRSEATLDTVADPALRSAIDAFFTRAGSFIRLSDETIRLSAAGRKAGAARWVHDVVTPAYVAANEASRAIRDRIARYNALSLQEIRQANRRVIRTLAGGVLGGLALAALTFFFGVRRVLAPVNRLAAAARRVSAGDYDVALEVSGRDETGVMAAAFNEMIRSQKRRVNELRGLLEVSEVVSSSLDLPTVLKWVLTSGYLLGAEEGMVLLEGPDGMAVRAATDDSLVVCGCALASGVRPSMQDRQPRVVALGQGGDGCEGCLAARGFRSALAVPMRTHRQRVGCLLFLTRQEGFDSHQVELATILGNQAAVAIENARLYSSLCDNYRNTISALVNALVAKSEYTGHHSEEMVDYGERVAVKLGLPPAEVELVKEACLLHDIGKIGIRDEILKKAGPLTPEEFAEVKRHAVIGAGIIAPPAVAGGAAWGAWPAATADPARHLAALSLIVRYHHERFDGTGYPDGLKREEIPLAARIVAVVDAFEAMTSDRPYRKAMSRRDAIEELRRCAGTQFDPQVVEAFVSVVLDRAGEGEAADLPGEGGSREHVPPRGAREA